MGEKKRMSKRVPLKKKYKIKKKIAEHNRKIRKAAKKNPGFVQKKLNKAVATRIPNSFPFKGDILSEAQVQQEIKREERRQKSKEARAVEFAKKRHMDDKPDMFTYAAKSLEEDLEFTKRADEKQHMLQEILNYTHEKKDTSMGAYYREFRKVVEQADVIIEVLDARDPVGCRCMDIESTIAGRYPNKKIVLLLNKIDLVPRVNAEKWLAYLRNSHPTVAFKASTQKKGRISQSERTFAKASDMDLQNSESLGADALLQLLKHFARTGTVRTSITVGIIGFPNVGKSSVINSLCRVRAAKVGATPGLTKTSQEIILDKHVKLLDTPGIVFPKATDVSDDLILRNVVKIEQVEDPLSPVATILKRCHKATLLSIYKIPDYTSLDQFLGHIAKKVGKLRKGGVPNLQAAAKIVLQDWTGGKIPFYTEPPKLGKDVHVGASIVTEFGADFDVTQAKLLDSLATLNKTAEMYGESVDMSEPIEANDVYMNQDGEDEDEDEDEGEGEGEGDMDNNDINEDNIDELLEESDDDAVPALVATKLTKQSKEGAKSKKQDLSDEADQYNPQVNAKKKKQQKQEQKKKQKEFKKAVSVSQPAKAGPYDDSDYNFATDFASEQDMYDDDVDVDV